MSLITLVPVQINAMLGHQRVTDLLQDTTGSISITETILEYCCCAANVVLLLTLVGQQKTSKSMFKNFCFCQLLLILSSMLK